MTKWKMELIAKASETEFKNYIYEIYFQHLIRCASDLCVAQSRASWTDLKYATPSMFHWKYFSFSLAVQPTDIVSFGLLFGICRQWENTWFQTNLAFTVAR